MMRGWIGSTLAAALAAMTASPAAAHHRQTPSIVQLTQTGDNTLPRLPVPSQTLVLSLGTPGYRDIFLYHVRDLGNPKKISKGGDNANPTAARGSRLFVWDTTGGAPTPGRQLAIESELLRFPDFLNDSSGTSGNPSVNRTGVTLAFESRGDLARSGNTGARQILVTSGFGEFRQVSRGVGESRNPALGGNADVLAFDSTSDPVTGAHTGIPQIWVADLARGTADRITNGQAASEFPSVSMNSRVVAFQSRAALDGNGSDAGVPQIYIYDTYTNTFAKVTNHPAGCTMPSIRAIFRDYRIAYTCGGSAYFTDLRREQQYRLPIDHGDTNRAVVEMGNHFLILSTTANLVNGGLHSGHQLYLWNLSKRPATPVPATVQWFPTQGMPSY